MTHLFVLMRIGICMKKTAHKQLLKAVPSSPEGLEQLCLSLPVALATEAIDEALR